MSFEFITIDEPAAVGPNKATEVTGISPNTAVIVGGYTGAGAPIAAAFEDFEGAFSLPGGPVGATSYAATGVNDLNEMVGVFTNGSGTHGYLKAFGNFYTLDDPSGVNGTVAYGINNSGEIVGTYVDGANAMHAFTEKNGIYSDLFPPATSYTDGFGINAAGDIVGAFGDATGFHGFFDDHGTITQLDVPGATLTLALGVNDNNEIVGYYTDSNNVVHDFLYRNGHYTTFDVPNATQITAEGINDNGVIVGSYTDASGVTRGFVAEAATPNALYSDGHASVLWRNGAGLNTWAMNGGSIDSIGTVTYQGQTVAPDASWSVAGIADFNADGIADVMWHQAGGQLALWQMQGSTVTASSTVTYNGTALAPDASWNVVGVADFDADSQADMLWRAADGSLAMWTMSGSTVTASNTVTSGGSAVAPDASWNVAGVGDFDGNGYSDVLWRQNSGSLAIWNMNGSNVASSATVTYQGNAVTPDASFSVAGIGDFNGDGQSDILWRQSSGALDFWQMNGSSIASCGAITSAGSAVSPDATWHIVEIGDFNGDGSSDIMWRNDNGTMAEWLMNGSQITSSLTPQSSGGAVTPDASWTVQGKPTNFA